MSLWSPCRSSFSTLTSTGFQDAKSLVKPVKHLKKWTKIVHWFWLKLQGVQPHPVKCTVLPSGLSASCFSFARSQKPYRPGAFHQKLDFSWKDFLTSSMFRYIALTDSIWFLQRSVSVVWVMWQVMFEEVDREAAVRGRHFGPNAFGENTTGHGHGRFHSKEETKGYFVLNVLCLAYFVSFFCVALQTVWFLSFHFVARSIQLFAKYALSWRPRNKRSESEVQKVQVCRFRIPMLPLLVVSRSHKSVALCLPNFLGPRRYLSILGVWEMPSEALGWLHRGSKPK